MRRQRFAAHLWIEKMRVNDGSLDVVEISVVLECALQQTGLLAQLRDMCAVVVREHLVAQDRVSNLHNQNRELVIIVQYAV